METDHLEAGEPEVGALEEAVQGAPLLLAPSARSLAREAWIASRRRSVAAVLLGAGALCALAAGRGLWQEPSSRPAAELGERAAEERLQLSEVPLQSSNPVNGFSDTLHAFEAKIHKTNGSWNEADRLAYEQYQQEVAADQSKAKLAGGRFAAALANAVESRKSAPLKLNHTNRTLGVHVPRSSGKVSELYTFGAPGTAVDPLYDATRSDGCIQGLRTYSRGIRFSPGVGAMFKVYDPVAWICNAVDYKHPHMDSLQALQSNSLNNPVGKCGQNYLEPPADGFLWITGHLVYPKILTWHTQALPDPGRAAGAVPGVSNNVAPNDWRLKRRRLGAARSKRAKVEKAALMAHFAFMNYRDTPSIGADVQSWGWNLVGRACGASKLVAAWGGVLGLPQTAASDIGRQVTTFADACKDHTILYQNNETLDCALVFEGSDDFMDWLANFDFAPAPFCGLGLVHSGFRAKVLRMVGGLDYSQVIRPHLKHCRRLDLVGHSLGAAQAELFTACANRMLKKGESGYGDYRLFWFYAGTPKRLPHFYEDHAQGVFLRNKGTGMCMDVKGTLATDYASDIILFYCELPNSGFNWDQQWWFKDNGLIVNKRSGKCMTTAEGGHRLLQWQCNPSDATQQWNLTSEGFLQNRGSKKCVNGDLNMRVCPFTDQKFELREDGHLVNLLSGLCVDVRGNPGVSPGDDILLWDCEFGEDTDQLWELTPEGVLKNKLSGLCMNLKPQEGREDRPSLVLGPCNTGYRAATMVWTMSAGGFLRNRIGKCMDVKGYHSKPGSLLVINACEEGSLNVAGVWERMPGGFIKNIGKEKDQQYRCITVFGRVWDKNVKNANGTWLMMRPCKLNTDQKWEITSGGFIKNVLGGQKCLDLVPRTFTLTGKMWLMNCAAWDDVSLFLNLKWVLGTHTLRNKQRQSCVAYSTVPGVLGLLSCKEARQQAQGALWTQRPDGGIQVGTLCLDVGAPLLPGGPMPVALKTCLPNVADTTQDWDVMSNGFLRSRYHSLCMGIQPLPGHPELPYGGGIFLQSCPITTQLWRMLPTGQIQNRITGKCVDALRNVTGTAWWDITEWDCDASRKEQHWEQIAG